MTAAVAPFPTPNSNAGRNAEVGLAIAVLFIIALVYMLSGVFWRLLFVLRRRGNPPPPAYTQVTEAQ